jgi:hypothetical protein
LTVLNLRCGRRESQSERPDSHCFVSPYLTPLSYISLADESPFLVFGFFLNFPLVLDPTNCFLMTAACNFRVIIGTYSPLFRAQMNSTGDLVVAVSPQKIIAIKNRFFY